MKTKLFKLSTILEFKPKSRRKASEGLSAGRYPFFTSSQNQTKWIDQADYKSESLILGTGGTANVHYATEFATTSHVAVLGAKTENISVKYIYYFFSANKALLERGFKGVGLKNLSNSYIENIEIPLPVDKKGRPSLPEQLRIVELMDAMQELKNKRTEADGLTSGVIPALYSKMFGGKQFAEAKIEQIVPSKESIRTGPFGSDLLHSEFRDVGIPVLGIDNAVSNRFEWGKIRCVTAEKYEKFKRFRVFPSDVLVTIMGTVGRVCVTPENLPESMSSKHLCVITTDKEKVDPIYLWATLLFDREVRHQTKQVAKGAIMEGWNSSIIKNLRIAVPPMTLQKEFAEVVKGIQLQQERQSLSAKEILSLDAALATSVFALKV